MGLVENILSLDPVERIMYGKTAFNLNISPKGIRPFAGMPGIMLAYDDVLDHARKEILGGRHVTKKGYFLPGEGSGRARTLEATLDVEENFSELRRMKEGTGGSIRIVMPEIRGFVSLLLNDGKLYSPEIAEAYNSKNSRYGNLDPQPEPVNIFV